MFYFYFSQCSWGQQYSIDLRTTKVIGSEGLWPDPCFSVALLFTLWFLGVLKPLPPNMLCGLYGDVNQSEQEGLSTGNVLEV